MTYKISQVELSYWFAKTSKSLLGHTAKHPSIHAVINAKAGIKAGTLTDNALAIVTLRLKGGKGASESLFFGGRTGPEKRAAILLRWQRNLAKSRKR